MIAALGVGAAYAADAVGFVVMLGVTRGAAALPPAPTDAEHPPILQSIGEGLRVRAPQGRADGLVRDRPGGDDVRDAARAVRRARARRSTTPGRAAPASSTRRSRPGATIAALTTGWVEHARWLGPDRDRRGDRLGARRSPAPASCRRCGPPPRCSRSPARADSVSAVCRSIINQTMTPEELRGRMSAIFMLVVTSGPRLGDLESGHRRVADHRERRGGERRARVRRRRGR